MSHGPPFHPPLHDPSLNADSPFPPATEGMWRAAATKALGGRPPDELASHTRDGIAIRPVYSDRAPATRLYTRDGEWVFFERIDAPDLSAAPVERLAAVDGHGIELVLATSPHAGGRGLPLDTAWLARALRDIARLRIDCGLPPPGLIPLLNARGAGGHGGADVMCDPVGIASGMASGGAAGEADWQPMLGLIGTGNVLAIADGRIWHNAGATEAEELAAVLAAMVAWLRRVEEAGHEPTTVWDRSATILVATPEILLSVAKLRAARLLFRRLVSGFADDTDAPSPLPIHAETSLRRTATRDPAMNLLRNGASAFAAVVGGADSLTVRPHEDSPRAARLACNVSRLLHHEARLGAIADPGAGSGAIEALTLDLARAAWRLFQEIEAGGGLEALVRSGAWQERIRQSAADEDAAVRRGDIALVGAHRFLAGNEADPPAPATGNRRLGDIASDPSA